MRQPVSHYLVTFAVDAGNLPELLSAAKGVAESVILVEVESVDYVNNDDNTIETPTQPATVDAKNNDTPEVKATRHVMGGRASGTPGRKVGVIRPIESIQSGVLTLEALLEGANTPGTIGEALQSWGLKRTSAAPALSALRQHGLVHKEGGHWFPTPAGLARSKTEEHQQVLGQARRHRFNGAAASHV